MVDPTLIGAVRGRGVQLLRTTPPAGRGVKLDQKDLATCRARGLAGPEALRHLQDSMLGGEVLQVQLDPAPCRWRGPQQLHPSALHTAPSNLNFLPIFYHGSFPKWNSGFFSN
ncbi:hypothetical protein V6N11_035099 [Hibiscus sabdariffa]|uniref:Uncharacterized protein n=1 Tax=Hibiscus sabdariffa TaxID=183260 RepID=A0ABR2QZD6_9ROSI